LSDITAELGGLLSTVTTVLGPLAVISMVLFMEKIVKFMLGVYKKKYIDEKMKEAVMETPTIVE